MIAKDIRRGYVILYNNVPHRVLEFQHRTPGNLRAFVQAKLRNLNSGLSTEARFSSTENLEKLTMDHQEVEYLYAEGDTHHFMNTVNYEQIELRRDALGDAVDFMTPGVKIQLELHDGKPVGVELPQVVELAVVETTPELRGATASNSPKPAKLETGVTISVPAFVKEGDRVRVDPSTGNYLERVK